MVYRRPGVLLLGALLFVLGCLQFLWLPHKASTLNDPLMMRDAPRTLEGIYRYTLGAFPQMKFAFPLWAIPDRIVLYLFIGMYLVHVFFFVQYRVFDLDVFFIPAYLLYALFVGYGVHRLVVYVYGLEPDNWYIPVLLGQGGTSPQGHGRPSLTL